MFTVYLYESLLTTYIHNTKQRGRGGEREREREQKPLGKGYSITGVHIYIYILHKYNKPKGVAIWLGMFVCLFVPGMFE